jgi:type IV secretory pathway VirB4 component
MSDLIQVLGETVGAESLVQRLTKFTQGTFAGLLNQPTNVVLNNQLLIFSIRDLEDQLRPMAMYIILGHIWNVVRSELKRRILVIDEAWIMMQYEDSARFVFSMAKRARKYYLGITTITQDVADFMNSPYGKPIVTNSSIQLLLKQSPAAIDVIADTFFLTEGEKYLLLESDVGEGIFFAGLKHAAIKIYASYVEDQIITTDPKQLLEIKQSKEELVS